MQKQGTHNMKHEELVLVGAVTLEPA